MLYCYLVKKVLPLQPNYDYHKTMTLRPIAIGLSPNTFLDDYAVAFKTLLKPWRWQSGDAVTEVENWFAAYLSTADVVSFNAGRSALLGILSALNISRGDEVLIQAFTCVAVPNSIVWNHATPVFVDIDDSFNIDLSDAQKKITPQTKALIVQHTFGIPAEMSKIVAFCKKNKLLLIEDCAHALGATYKEKKCGTFGDAAFFSFGRDKIVSSVFGGVGVIYDSAKQPLLRMYQQKLAQPKTRWIVQQLLHPLLFSLILPLYNVFSLGKGIIWISMKVGLLSYPVYEAEKKGLRPNDFPKKFPNALAMLALNQLKKLEQLNQRRKEITQKYEKAFASQKIKTQTSCEGSIFLRFSILTPRADELRFKAKRHGVLLGNWYHHVVDPKGYAREKYYREGSCIQAESTATRVVNLPTYPTLTNEQVDIVINLVHSICNE